VSSGSIWLRIGSLLSRALLNTVMNLRVP
jgi:hypothetical protein